MHIVVIFINIGSYHAARLRAAESACLHKGWHLTAVQVTDDTLEHPWGNLAKEITFPLKTILPKQIAPPDAQLAASKLPGFLDQLQPDILVIPGWGFPISRAALNWGKRHHIPTIVMSETKWDDEPRWWWKEYLKYLLYIRKFDAAIVGGKQHRDYLTKLGFARNKIFLGYDAVDNNYFTQQAAIARENSEAARKRQPKIPSKPYFLTVTRLLKRKNLHRLIEAFVTYRHKVDINEAWDLVICGSGEEQTAIQSFINQTNLQDCIHLPGFIGYQDIGDWYGMANALIHPALQEPWGLVVNEACAAGLPILCSRTVGAGCEMVRDGQNGWLFDPKSIEEISHALLKMHHLDVNSRIKMGRFSQQIVANYSPEYFSDGLLKAIDVLF